MKLNLFSFVYRLPDIEVKFDKSGAEMVERVVHAVIAIYNASRGGTVTLKPTQSSSPDEKFMQSFEQRLSDLGLMQPIDFSLQTSDFSHDERVIIHPTTRKILYFLSENTIKGQAEGKTGLENGNWGVAYTKCTRTVRRINNTESLSRIFQNNEVYRVPVYPSEEEHIVEKSKLLFEERNAVEFYEFTGGDLEEILKCVSALANTTGGLIALGVKEDGDIKGIQFGKIPNATALIQEIQKCIYQHSIWIKSNKEGELKKLRKQDIGDRLEFKEYGILPDSKSKTPVKSAVFIKVHRLRRGVVFTKTPRCPYYDEDSCKVMYTDEASINIWCKMASEYIRDNKKLP